MVSRRNFHDPSIILYGYRFNQIAREKNQRDDVKRFNVLKESTLRPGYAIVSQGGFLAMAACPSMIVHDLDLLRSFIGPSEHDPPLIVDPDRMLTGEVPSQGFQAVPRQRQRAPS
jgi:hypothetical protein